MRRVAASLSVVPMTLYTYVPGKAELLDLMLDARLPADAPHPAPPGSPWRQRVTAIAAENGALFETHPWAPGLSTIRPPLGPGLMAKYDHELSAFDGPRPRRHPDGCRPHSPADLRSGLGPRRRRRPGCQPRHRPWTTNSGGPPASPCYSRSSTHAPSRWPSASEPPQAPPTAPPTTPSTPTTSACRPSSTGSPRSSATPTDRCYISGARPTGQEPYLSRNVGQIPDPRPGRHSHVAATPLSLAPLTYRGGGACAYGGNRVPAIGEVPRFVKTRVGVRHADGSRAYEQEKSLSVGDVTHWVTATIPPPVRGAELQFVFAWESVLAPGIQFVKG